MGATTASFPYSIYQPGNTFKHASTHEHTSTILTFSTNTNTKTTTNTKLLLPVNIVIVSQDVLFKYCRLGNLHVRNFLMFNFHRVAK